MQEKINILFLFAFGSWGNIVNVGVNTNVRKRSDLIPGILKICRFKYACMCFCVHAAHVNQALMFVSFNALLIPSSQFSEVYPGLQSQVCVPLEGAREHVPSFRHGLGRQRDSTPEITPNNFKLQIYNFNFWIAIMHCITLHLKSYFQIRYFASVNIYIETCIIIWALTGTQGFNESSPLSAVGHNFTSLFPILSSQFLIPFLLSDSAPCCSRPSHFPPTNPAMSSALAG